jgi:hypothetical protein
MKKDFKPQDGFDAEVVTIVDREFNYDAPFLSIMGDRKSGEFLDLDQNVWHLWREQSEIKRQRWLKNAKGKNYAGRRLQYHNLVKEYNKNYSILSGKVKRDVLEIIMEGRLKLAFLIDSDGGDMALCNMYRNALKALDSRSHSEAYITCHAASASFELMTAVNQPVMAKKSYLFWHFSGTSDSRRQDVEKLKTQADVPENIKIEMDELLDYFYRSRKVDKEFLDTTLRMLTDEDNPEGDLIFCGTEIAELELAKAYPTVEAMQRRFNGHYMTRIDPYIKEFWDISLAIVEEMEDKFWGHFDVEGMRDRMRLR